MSWQVRTRFGRHVPWALSCALAALAPTSARAADEVHFLVRPEIGAQAGFESYELALTIPQDGIDVTAESTLTYPVAAPLAGGTVRLDVGRFSIAATAWTNLANPWGTMTDQDFLTASNGVVSQRLEFSHTDSRTELRALVLEGALRYRFADLGPGRRWGVYGVAGLRHEGSAYRVYGASGWQLDPNMNRVNVALPGEPLALRYDVHHYFPFIGVGTTLAADVGWTVDAEVRLIVSVSDHRDDHVIRQKLGKADSSGVGGALIVEPAFILGESVQMRFGAHAEAQYVAGGGTLRQHYYADDPTIDGDQLSTPIPDSHFSFTSLRARLLAFVGARF